MNLKTSIAKLCAVLVVISMVISATGLTPAQASPAARGTTARYAGETDQAPAASKLPSFDPNKTIRVIIQLADAPLASYKGGAATLSTSSGKSHLDVASPTSQSYVAALKIQQASARLAILKSVPDAKFDARLDYQVLLNGMTATIKAGDMDKIRAVAGVKSVTPERAYTLDMDTSIPLIGLGTGTVGSPAWADAGLWTAVGGHQNAGKGIKVADIDSGITPASPCFDPTGYTYPAGYPKFDAGFNSFVSPKIIVARAYFRADDPPYYPATPADDPADVEGGHGDHTAGTIVM